MLYNSLLSSSPSSSSSSRERRLFRTRAAHSKRCEETLFTPQASRVLQTLELADLQLPTEACGELLTGGGGGGSGGQSEREAAEGGGLGSLSGVAHACYHRLRTALLPGLPRPGT